MVGYLSNGWRLERPHAPRRRLSGGNPAVSDIPGATEPMHFLDAWLVAAYPRVPPCAGFDEPCGGAGA